MIGSRVRAPDLSGVERIAQDALATIPAELRRHARDVIVQVREFPDDETLEEMGCETPFDILGLYRGVSIDRKSVGDVATDLDMVFLYRRPILDYWCESGEDLEAIVRHVLIHEIGHHFGFSDEDMESIEARG